MMKRGHFKDREQAGEQLAQRLETYARQHDAYMEQPEAIVLALPRGGVPVGYAVANALDLPLDVLIVRKLGVPGHEELAMGAITSSGLRVLRTDTFEMFDIPEAAIEQVVQVETSEMQRREKKYRGDRPAPDLQGRVVILIDDGLATGSTMLVAARAVRRQEPARIIVAVPVASEQACKEIGSEVDEIVCLITPSPFYAVGMWYEEFDQTSDEEVIHLLERAYQRPRPSQPAAENARPGRT